MTAIVNRIASTFSSIFSEDSSPTETETPTTPLARDVVELSPETGLPEQAADQVNAVNALLRAFDSEEEPGPNGPQERPEQQGFWSSLGEGIDKTFDKDWGNTRVERALSDLGRGVKDAAGSLFGGREEGEKKSGREETSEEKAIQEPPNDGNREESTEKPDKPDSSDPSGGKNDGGEK